MGSREVPSLLQSLQLARFDSIWSGGGRVYSHAIYMCMPGYGLIEHFTIRRQLALGQRRNINVRVLRDSSQRRKYKHRNFKTGPFEFLWPALHCARNIISAPNFI